MDLSARSLLDSGWLNFGSAKLTALITRLNRWAFDIAIRAVHAAIAGHRL
jgi:hypothetical protein